MRPPIDMSEYQRIYQRREDSDFCSTGIFLKDDERKGKSRSDIGGFSLSESSSREAGTASRSRCLSRAGTEENAV